jgi:hypothetical protein
MQLGHGAARTHLVDMGADFSVAGRGVVPDPSHAHNLREHEVCIVQVGHADRDRAEATDLVLGRHGAALPWMGLLALPAVIDEAEALALEILEVEGEPAIALDDLGLRDAQVLEALLPPGERVSARDPHGSAGDAVGAALLAFDWPIEEGDVGAGRAASIGVEQVVSADVVLVDGLLHQPQPERLGVEGVIGRGVAGDGGEMMDAGELHGHGPCQARRADRPACRGWLELINPGLGEGDVGLR